MLKARAWGLYIILGFILAAFLISKRQQNLDYIDSGEIAASTFEYVQIHPTGYPLYINLVSPLARQINPLTAGIFFSILCGLALYPLSIILIKTLDDKGVLPFYATGIISLFFAGGVQIINQAKQNEVYSLTAVLATLIIILLFKSSKKPEYRLILAYLAGLSLCNHMLIYTLSIPSIIFISYKTIKEKKYRMLSLMLFLFCLAGSLYLFLPIRGGFNYFLNWGNPVNMTNFIRHVTGRQYSIWMFQDWDVITPNLIRFLKNASTEYQYLPIILLIPGFIYLQKKYKKTLYLLLFTLTFAVFYIVNYIIPDIEGYYLIPFIIISSIISSGIIYVYTFYAKVYLRILAISLIGIISIYRLVTITPYSSLPNEISNDLNKSLNFKAVVFSNNWDYYSPALYHQVCDYIRPDLFWIDTELLRRTWYIKYLSPLLKEANSIHRDPYLIELKKFEADKLKDSTLIQAHFVGMVQEIVDYYSKKNAVQSLIPPGYNQDEKEMFGKYQALPQGYSWILNPKQPPAMLDPFDTRWSVETSKFSLRDTIAIKVLAYPWFTLAENLMQSDDFRSAKRVLKSLTIWGLDDARSRGALAYSLYNLEEYDEAKLELSKIKEPGKYIDQIKKLEEVLRETPDK